jgi:Uma2 family endonuclease
MPGDHLSRGEFHRRYGLLPKGQKAELIDGIVQMPSPVSLFHQQPADLLYRWAAAYCDLHPDYAANSNVTVILDEGNELQPDVLIRRLPERGGQTRVSETGYLLGAPEWVGEVTRTTASYDLYEKKEAYRRHGCLDYVCWLTEESRLCWWTADGDGFRELAPHDGVLASPHLPGLRLDAGALLAGNALALFAALKG